MKIRKALLRYSVIGISILLGIFVSVANAETSVSYVPGEVLLKVQLGVNIVVSDGRVSSNNSELADILDKYGAKNAKELFPGDIKGTILSRTYKLVFDKTADVFSVVADLCKLECVDYAHLNYIANFSAVPTDDSWSEEWGQQKMACEEAWDLFTGSENVIVAVVDSGLYYSHLDLEDNIWINADEIPGNGIDDDGNGYVDDYHGYDFVNDDAEPEDNIGHGTHVAGIIGAVANNSIVLSKNIAGVLWDCQIIAAKAGDYWLLDDDIAEAIRYSADNGAQVINMSFGGYGTSSVIESAIEYAHNKDVVLVAAAGNENTSDISYPAGYDNVIAVAATDEDDIKASFSNYGDWVDISAPGVNILSTIPNNQYDSWSGTSMASPMVSGVCGLILGYADTLGQSPVPAEVESILKTTADDIDDNNPNYVGLLGAGRANAYNALYYMQNEELPPQLLTLKIARQDGGSSYEINEYESLELKATGYYSDGTEADLTDQVTWVVRPIRYGRFSSSVAGKFNALDVSADREVVVTAYIVTDASAISGSTVVKNYKIITIKDNPSAYPLVIEGDDSVGVGGSGQFVAKFSGNDVTSDCQWSVTEGISYASFDPSVAGKLVINADATVGATVKIKALYIDSDARISYEVEKQITITSPTSDSVAGLFVTGRSSVAAGSTLTVRAWLAYQGQAQLQEVTADAEWTPDSPDAEGGYFTQPGTFLAKNVSSDTDVTLTAKYTVNGTTYQASVTVTVLPATPAGEYIESNDDSSSADDNGSNDESSDENSLNDDIQEFLNNVPCAGIGTIIVGLVMLAGLVLIKED